MANQEEIEEMIQLFHTIHPHHSRKQIDKVSAGMGAVLRYLSTTEGLVTAGQIAAQLEISTARVAALLKKMEAKDLIIRETGPKDARTTVVRLSDHGEETVEKLRLEIYGQVGRMIDTIGMPRLKEFVMTAQEMIKIVEKPSQDILENFLD